MQRSRLGAIALGATALLGTTLASPALAATDSEIPTFSQFRSTAYQDTDRQYIVNGDEPIPTTGELKAYYDRMVHGTEEAMEEGLVVNTVGGVDDKWSTSQVGNLTYCVSDHVRVALQPTSSTRWQRRPASGKALLSGQLHPRAVAGRAAAPRATSRCCSVEPVQTTRVHRPGVLPEHAQALAQRAGRRLDLRPRALDARRTSSATSWATRSASATSTPGPRPAPASRTTTGAR